MSFLVPLVVLPASLPYALKLLPTTDAASGTQSTVGAYTRRFLGFRRWTVFRSQKPLRDISATITAFDSSASITRHFQQGRAWRATGLIYRRSLRFPVGVLLTSGFRINPSSQARQLSFYQSQSLGSHGKCQRSLLLSARLLALPLEPLLRPQYTAAAGKRRLRASRQPPPQSPLRLRLVPPQFLQWQYLVQLP